MPTVFLPGIGATMRTLGTRRAIARSSARSGDLRQPQAGFELDFVLGDDRAGLDLDDLDVEAEVLERLFEDLRLAADFLLVLLVADFVVRQQQIERRQLVVDFLIGLLVGRFELLDHLVALGFLLAGGRAPAAALDAEGRLQAVGELRAGAGGCGFFLVVGFLFLVGFRLFFFGFVFVVFFVLPRRRRLLPPCRPGCGCGFRARRRRLLRPPRRASASAISSSSSRSVFTRLGFASPQRGRSGPSGRATGRRRVVVTAAALSRK